MQTTRAVLPSVKRVYVDRTGLEMFLGNIEVPIMRAVWEGRNTITEIHRYVCREYTELAKSSISTTVQRLVEKQYLIKIPVADSKHREHIYLPCTNTEEELVSIIMQIVIRKLHDNYGDEVHIALALAEMSRPSLQELP